MRFRYLRRATAPSAVATRAGPLGSSLNEAGILILRVGLVLVLALIGILKFTPEEAHGIQTFVVHSPLFAWLNFFLSNQQLSDFFGVFEISAAILIALRFVSPIASAIGSAMAVIIFLSTMSFLLTTPGAWTVQHGLPLLGDLGGFLIKDVTLFGAAVTTLGEALQAKT